MSDPVFSGANVDDAVASAAEGLGRDVADIRFVVLDAGSPGGRGLSATPARVAVILEKPKPPREAAAETRRAPNVMQSVREVIESLIRAAELTVDVQVESGEDAVVVSLSGTDCDFFSGPDGEGEQLEALEHLLFGMFGRWVPSGRIIVRCEGHRERREEALRQEALRLAADVKRDGVARETAPMNSYERRIIHVTVSAIAGVVTYSVGEGADRRVTIAGQAFESGQPPTAGGD
jgi:spoIIIJ-associated protein